MRELCIEIYVCGSAVELTVLNLHGVRLACKRLHHSKQTVGFIIESAQPDDDNGNNFR